MAEAQHSRALACRAERQLRSPLHASLAKKHYQAGQSFSLKPVERLALRGPGRGWLVCLPPPGANAARTEGLPPAPSFTSAGGRC
jgi:hypothetical protein